MKPIAYREDGIVNTSSAKDIENLSGEEILELIIITGERSKEYIDSLKEFLS